MMEEQKVVVEQQYPSRRRGIPPFSWYAAVPLLALTGLLVWWLYQVGRFVADHIGAYWSAHWPWIVGISAVLLFVFALPRLWRGWVALSRHHQEMEDRRAKRQLLLTTRLAVEVGGQHGFNTRLQSPDLLVESINPLSLAAASKTSNNYFGIDAPGEPVDVEEEGELAPLEMIRLSELLRDEEVLPDEEESIIGYQRDGEPVIGRLFDIQDNLYNSLFVVGDQGYGKSSLAVLLAAYTVFHRGRLLVIDPEKGQAQSLSRRLGPLAHRAFLLCEIADTPQKAEQLLEIAEREIEEPGDYPLCLLIDELSMIARAAETNMGKWASVGKRILAVAEDYATRGRKRIRRAVVMGQFTQGKKSGGTALRYAMACMAFRIDQKQARLVLEPEDAAIAPTLVPGEVIVIPSRSSEPKVQMQVVYPDEEGLTMIAQTLLEESDLVEEELYPRPYLVPRMGTGPEASGTWDRVGVEPDFEEVPQQFPFPRNIGAQRHTTHLSGLVPVSGDGLVERPGQVPQESRFGPDDLVMTTEQVALFLKYYPSIGDIKKTLSKIPNGRGKFLGNRYYTHGRQLVEQHQLRKAGGSQS